jgi:hypothetical protein
MFIFPWLAIEYSLGCHFSGVTFLNAWREEEMFSLKSRKCSVRIQTLANVLMFTQFIQTVRYIRRAAAEAARRRLLTAKMWVQPRLRFILGTVALKRSYFQVYSVVLYFSSFHYCSLLIFATPRGVGYPWPGSTLSHPQVLNVWDGNWLALQKQS